MCGVCASESMYSFVDSALYVLQVSFTRRERERERERERMTDVNSLAGGKVHI